MTKLERLRYWIDVQRHNASLLLLSRPRRVNVIPALQKIREAGNRMGYTPVFDPQIVYGGPVGSRPKSFRYYHGGYYGNPSMRRRNQGVV
jgi:hypothetical protein